jgi:hypothetical protein
MSAKKKIKISNRKEILSLAPQVKNLTALAKHAGVSRMTLNRYFNEDAAFEKQVKTVLGKDYVKEKDFSNTISPTPKNRVNTKPIRPKKTADEVLAKKTRKRYEKRKIVVEVADVNRGGNANHALRKEEQLYIGLKICELYETGITVEAAADAMKISMYTFYHWVNPKSPKYVEDIYIRFEQAKHQRMFVTNEELLFIALDGLKGKMRERTITNTIKTGRAQQDGRVTPHTVTQHVRTEMPNMAAIRLVLENLSPSFKKEKESQQDVDTDKLRFMSDEELDNEYLKAIKTLEEKKAE